MKIRLEGWQGKMSIALLKYLIEKWLICRLYISEAARDSLIRFDQFDIENHNLDLVIEVRPDLICEARGYNKNGYEFVFEY